MLGISFRCFVNWQGALRDEATRGVVRIVMLDYRLLLVWVGNAGRYATCLEVVAGVNEMQ